MQRALASLLVTLAVLHVLAFLGVALARAPYPFELEWQEGGMLAHAQRVLAGEPLYAAPDVEFAAFPYTPLFSYVSALAVSALGPSLLALRVVSIASTLAAFGLLFAYVRREGGSAFAGALSVGLFAASYRFTGAWYDVGRVDMLAWALCLGGLYVLRFGAGRRAAGAAGVLFFLAFAAKQTALVSAAALVLPAFARRRDTGLVFAGTWIALVVASSAAYHVVTDGWSTWYVYELLRGHRWFAPWRFPRELALALGPALLAVMLGARRGAERSRGDGAPALSPFTWTAALASLAAAWLGRAHEGGYDNTLIPAALAVALLLGPALGAARACGGRRSLAVLVLALAQLAILARDPRDQLPSAADRREGERVVAALAALEGDVFAPYNLELARRAGKAPCIHFMAIEDLLKATESEPGSARHARGQAFVDRLVEAVEGRRWAALVMAQRRPDLEEVFLRAYAEPRPLVDPTGDALAPVTGWPARPVWIYPRR